MIEQQNENPYVFLDVNFGKIKGGRIVIELFKNVVPKTVENFRVLCTGEKKATNDDLHYKGSKFHRVIGQCFVQAGDITNFDGTGGTSIYGAPFEDENFNILHEEEGMVGMCNSGPNSNTSQFYITTVPCSHLDNTNVVFGKVKKGLKLVEEMAEIPRDLSNVPLEDILITNCGELKPGEPWNIEESDETNDAYPPWPDDWDETDPNKIENAINSIKESGNYFFKQLNFVDSQRKYVKALRYIDWYMQKYPENTRKIEKMVVDTQLNLAAAKLKNSKFKDVIQICDKVIEKHPRNGKAFYRRAQAELSLMDYDKALKDLLTATLLHPNDENIKNCMSVAKKRKRTYLEEERIFYAKVFKN